MFYSIKKNTFFLNLKIDNNMHDIEKLLDNTMPFIVDLLKKHGEFFPLATTIKTNDSIAQIGTYNLFLF